MITSVELKKLLFLLGFKNNGDIWSKRFEEYSCELAVDFKNKKLIYPDSIEGRLKNVGFESCENFVVFECVNRLLEKGYRPDSIILEKEWHLGHDAKSGRADICILSSDKQNNIRSYPSRRIRETNANPT